MSDTEEDLPRDFEDLDIKWALRKTEEGAVYRARDRKLGRDVVVNIGQQVGGEGLEHPFIRQGCHGGRGI